MNNMYDLLKGIRAKCRQDQWFGSEQSGPAWNEDVPVDDLKRFDFAFPPASEEQLSITEKLLGFALPQLLRALYAEVANGGFGPGGGLRGAYEGYGKPGTIYPDEDETIIGAYRFESRRGTVTIVGNTTQGLGARTRISLQLPYGIWPEYVLPICNFGCVQEICVDNQERMFVAAPIDSNEVYWFRQLPWTLEEWLWRWVRDEDLVPRYAEAA